jgi:hypothetical protein
MTHTYTPRKQKTRGICMVAGLSIVKDSFNKCFLAETVELVSREFLIGSRSVPKLSIWHAALKTAPKKTKPILRKHLKNYQCMIFTSNFDTDRMKGHSAIASGFAGHSPLRNQ